MSREPVYDTYRQDLPDGPLASEDIRRLRFGIALRGYAMGQVDDVLDRLAAEIAARDARIAELTSFGSPGAAPAVDPESPTVVGLTHHFGGAPVVAESGEVIEDPKPRRAQHDAS